MRVTTHTLAEGGKASGRLRAYLDLCRVSNLPTVWTNVLAGVVLSGATWDVGECLVLALALSCFYAGGMCLNDLCDVAWDRAGRPDRPLPSGRVSVPEARGLTLALFAAGFAGLGVAAHPVALAPGVALLAAIWVYDRYHKEGAWSVLVMAACRLLVFVVAGTAVAGRVGGGVWIGGFAQYAYVLLLSAVARIEGKRPGGFGFPVIPVLIAGISLLDGVMMALLAAPGWLIAGLAGAAVTILGQRRVRGD